MRTLLTVLLFLIGGIGAGFITAAVAINNGLGPFSVKNGPWTIWPTAGKPNADPYTKAHFAAIGEFPLISTESLGMRADRDSQGQPLQGNCTYALTGQLSEVRLWTLTVYDESGQLIENPANRSAFNSENVLRRGDGRFEIKFGARAEPGNWIPTGDAARVFLMLRLYNSEPVLLSNLEGAGLPEITKLRCE